MFLMVRPAGERDVVGSVSRSARSSGVVVIWRLVREERWMERPGYARVGWTEVRVSLRVRKYRVLAFMLVIGLDGVFWGL
jgi:hypothetical protein